MRTLILRISSTWNISRNDSKFEYYEQFILTVSSAKYYNLEIFGDYANDKSLDDIDFLQVAYDVMEKF